jgi:hypothetical protein
MGDTSHDYRNAYAASAGRCLTMEEMNLMYPNPHLDVRSLTPSLKAVA